MQAGPIFIRMAKASLVHVHAMRLQVLWFRVPHRTAGTDGRRTPTQRSSPPPYPHGDASTRTTRITSAPMSAPAVQSNVTCPPTEPQPLFTSTEKDTIRRRVAPCTNDAHFYSALSLSQVSNCQLQANAPLTFDDTFYLKPLCQVHPSGYSRTRTAQARHTAACAAIQSNHTLQHVAALPGGPLPALVARKFPPRCYARTNESHVHLEPPADRWLSIARRCTTVLTTLQV